MAKGNYLVWVEIPGGGRELVLTTSVMEVAERKARRYRRRTWITQS